MIELEELSRDELIVAVRRQAGQITTQAVQISELMEANEALAARLARLERLLSPNSGNSSNPPSRDDDPGKPAPADKRRGRGGPKRARGKQPGTPGTHLAWTENPDQRRDRLVDRYQQHEIPQVAVTVTQYDQHQVECGCGKVHIAARPDGARSGPVGYGPNLAAFAVYLRAVIRVRRNAVSMSLTATHRLCRYQGATARRVLMSWCAWPVW